MVIGSGLELFSFGYWGWGSSTPLLLEATAAVEEARGHAPPCFVNVRVARSVRAVGFRDRAFEELAGSDRYVWMPELGNKRVADRGDGEAEIVEPAAAGDLLDLAIERARRKQRIIFFCACDYPGTSRAPGCHRLLVTELLLEEARRRNLAMGIGEWPGGEPQDVTIKVTRSEFEKISAAGLQLKSSLGLAEVAGLPWGSRVTAAHGGRRYQFIGGPGRPWRGSLVTPLLLAGDGNLEKAWRRMQRNLGLGWRRVDARRPTAPAQARSHRGRRAPSQPGRAHSRAR